MAVMSGTAPAVPDGTGVGVGGAVVVVPELPVALVALLDWVPLLAVLPAVAPAVAVALLPDPPPHAVNTKPNDNVHIKVSLFKFAELVISFLAVKTALRISDAHAAQLVQQGKQTRGPASLIVRLCCLCEMLFPRMMLCTLICMLSSLAN